MIILSNIGKHITSLIVGIYFCSLLNTHKTISFEQATYNIERNAIVRIEVPKKVRSLKEYFKTPSSIMKRLKNVKLLRVLGLDDLS